jgi:hypothetical protein
LIDATRSPRRAQNDERRHIEQRHDCDQQQYQLEHVFLRLLAA